MKLLLSEVNQWIKDYLELRKLPSHENKAAQSLPEAFQLLFNCVKEGISTDVAKKFGENIGDLGANQFLKTRGSYGQVFNIKHDFLLLLTAVSVKDKRIPLNDLFKELEKRGVAFDRYSKKEIISLFDDLNILDKKVIVEMHNMSNQFYNYISTLLVEYFKKAGIKKGDRFYLQLDSGTDVFHLVEALKILEGTKPFRYKHELGEEYETFSIPFHEINLVVAYTSKDVKPDFLVTLRNLVGEQKGVWENSALISIVSEQLDSIQGGSSDLQKEGMPLHPASLFNNLRNEIENRSLEKVDQIILLDNLNNLVKEQSFQQITFFEFEDIFATLQKGSIDDTDYHKFGLFKDADLDKFNGKEQRDRLRENRDLFDYVRKVHDFGLNKEELEKQFSPEGANELIKEEWRELPFSRVYKFNEDYRKLNKKKKVDLIGLKVNHTIKPWDKPYKESTSGKRKRHIIIFNPEGKEEIELQASFSLEGNVKSLSSEFLKVPNAFSKNLTVEVKQTNIFAKIKLEKDDTTFTRFSYKHDNKAALGAEFLLLFYQLSLSIWIVISPNI